MDSARRVFLEEQVEGLEPFGFVLLAVPTGPAAAVEVERSEDGATYSVTAVAGEPLPAELAQRLTAAGLAGEPPQKAELDAAAAAALADTVLHDAFGAEEAASLDVQHGSKRLLVETQRKVAALRERIGKVLTTVLDEGQPTVDPDGDWTFPFESTRVFVGPRALPDGTTAVLVFSPTNVGVEPTAALGLFLAEANFRFAFGRFALDAQNGVVWFGQNLFGDAFTDEELTFLVKIVATTSAAFDDRIAAEFGGSTYAATAAQTEPEQAPTTKPGLGGYL